ncbi:unnamed protein product, partial [Rotaria magnacalcarata]
RRREDIARVCNEARTRIEGTNEVLNERDRVTDAIVTHWFQNKRKMAKSQRGILFLVILQTYIISFPFVFVRLHFSINP